MPWRGLAFLSGAQQVRFAPRVYRSFTARFPPSGFFPRPAVAVQRVSTSVRHSRPRPHLRREALSQLRLSIRIAILGQSGCHCFSANTIAAISPWRPGPSWRCHFGPFARCHQHRNYAICRGRSTNWRSKTHYFLDCTVEETAEILQVSRRTDHDLERQHLGWRVSRDRGAA